MIEVLMTDPFRSYDVERLQDIEGFHIVWNPAPTEEQLAAAEIILGQPTPQSLLAAKQLRWLQTPNAGVDYYLNSPVAFPEDTALTNLSGAFGQSISEFCLTMCLMLYKHMHLYRDNQTAHVWKDEGWQKTPVDKHILILGAGNIGCDTARLFRTFRCRITGMWREPREIPEFFDDMITMAQLDETLPDADIIISALPATPATVKLFDRQRLALLKSDAVLINVGRGNLIDSDALAEVLQDKRILGAALDVTDPEPLPAEHPLWSCRNAIITPHITGGTFGHLKATEEALFDICRQNLIRYREGRPLLNLVDTKTGYRQVSERYHP